MKTPKPQRPLVCRVEPGPKHPDGATVTLCAECGRLLRECRCDEQDHA